MQNKTFLQFLFPSVIKHWNNLDLDTKSSETLPIFKNKLFKKIRPKKKEYFGIEDKDGTRLITLLRLGLGPLKKHKFTHNFLDTNDPMCISGDGVEDTEHFMLLCSSYTVARTTLIRKVYDISKNNFNLLSKKKSCQFFSMVMSLYQMT